MFLIKYIPNQNWSTQPSKLSGYTNQIILSGNNWDDYGSKTSFNMIVVLNNKEYKNWAVRILIEGESYSAAYLDKLCNEGWDGVFPIPNKNYISQFSDIDFYKTLVSVLEIEQINKILINFKDASYMKNIEKDVSILHLIENSIFTESLLRDTGSHKAFEEAWMLFEDNISSSINDFCFNYKDKKNEIKNIFFNFSKQLLPTDINVLIGANGVGKSHTIKVLSEYLLKVGEGDVRRLEGYQPFDRRPNFSNLILTSYSVFEDFLVDLSDENIKENEKENYKYFGLRARDVDNKNRIAIGRNIPSLDAKKAVFKMIYENYQYKNLNWWVDKLGLAKETLKKAFDFDELVIGVNEQADFSLISEYDYYHFNGKKYLILNEKLENFEVIHHSVKFENTIFFLKNNKIIKLSSGQKIFSYIVLNILGEIKESSLIIIDEPELFLHPTLEIEFIGLLKSILEPFKSKAILATHSLSIVREVPSSCVHIYKENELGLSIESPPFQTFGGDMQRISTYVFGDSLLKKPYENFLNTLLDSKKFTPTQLIDELGEAVNEEMIMDIKIWESLNGN
ncbi:AAA family ATPase [Acinetobacter sp. CWB-B33]|uniref:AAA family ATPase n=1 Tax=Acinetobacter sp. CWB-B33 TaxID=2815724 RepID=UPI0031FF3A19